jgi:hypothetical protein
MLSSRAQKDSAADSSNPLQQAGILQRVLDYVGPGHWCFLAEVSSLWRNLYTRVASRELQGMYSNNKVICCSQMTLCSAVFASPSRLRHAHAHKLRVSCKTIVYEHAAGAYADISTLQAARKLGMRYTEAAMFGAVRCNEVAVVQFLHAQGCTLSISLSNVAATRGYIAMCSYLHAENCPWVTVTSELAARSSHCSTLKWLREHGCPWDADSIHRFAAESGSVEALEFLQQQGIVFTTAKLRDMLNIAGAHSKLAAAKWLRQQGAEWPHVLNWYWYGQWSGDTLEWARAEGCTSPVEHGAN